MTIHSSTFSIRLMLLLIICTAACTANKNEKKIERYTAKHNRTVAHLKLTKYTDSFHGQYRITKPGNAIDSGEVHGKIVHDTLIGDFLYTPYKGKVKKRKPFVLLKKGDQYIQGSGRETIYMGITYYEPGSIHFQNAKFVFHPEK